MPKLTFLPFNVGEPLRPALGRQLANFLSEAYKTQPEVETNFVSFLTQVGSASEPAQAFVNLGSELNPTEFVENILQQSGADFAIDGTLNPADGGDSLTLRISKPGTTGAHVAEKTYTAAETFDVVRWLVSEVAKGCEIRLLPEFAEKMEFGTDSSESFQKFMLGFDAVNYVGQAGRQVAKEFDVSAAFDDLAAAIEADPDFLGPYDASLQLAALSAQNNVGTPELIEAKLNRLLELIPDDYRAQFALGDIYQGTGRPQDSMKAYEKAIRLMETQHAEKSKAHEADKEVFVPALDPGLYTRLGIIQQQTGMLANAERSFRKALELEGPDKPTMQFMTPLLANTNRGHEIPKMWKEVLNENPTNPEAWGRYAVSLVMAQKTDEARKAFEEALEKTDNHVLIKRHFAPFLAHNGDADRSMDFYEEVLEVAPNDVPVLVEYSQVLDNAGRTHEVPDVLKTLLAVDNLEPDLKAQAGARLFEIEQPKRVEAIMKAQQSMEREDHQAAIADLEPIAQWMPEYWKVWAMLSTLYNRVQRFSDAENAARRVMEIFPGCEPAYNELAGALAGQGKTEEAYTFLNQALQARPQSATIALSLAMAAKQTGRGEEAANLARQLREAAGPGNVEIERVLSEIERP
ncbi:MAG: tetratricopeptide repeat protein [Armatimonadota bacterium]|nr:tetratricopeptide repeat protein [Armatimonadota bacterium]